ncbi:hypothetical protein [Mesorhizobium huakuii]|uniref:Uncharacterized protein n=1 Tax=Mesorhizobium huakuii TaxID=28104 RepID=A0A7G6T0V0_9HYPH|nr:hypothetical protein [Mesorhizobium huakuii]QND60382.1 hypothetical protein HB778_30420 [Mesorhizobium huakuii]
MTEVKSIIVEAVGVSANASPNNPLGKRAAVVIEAAMSTAVLECMAAGIADPAEIRAQMLAARDKAKADFYGALLNPNGDDNGNDK